MSEARRAKRHRQREARAQRKANGPDHKQRYERLRVKSAHLGFEVASKRQQQLGGVQRQRINDIETFVEVEFDRLAIPRRHRAAVLALAVTLPPTREGMPDIKGAQRRRRAA